jgi:hypothetical protein
MALARRHFRFIVRDAYGFAIQNAKVNVFQPGTSTNFLGNAFDAASGGNAVTNPLTTNAQGEVEAWFDTEQSVDVQVDDNTDAAYRAIDGPGVPLSFTTFVEKDEDITLQPEDVADIENLPTAYPAAIVAHATVTAAFAARPHGAADHTNITKQLWLPINDGVVVDGGTLASIGTAPDIIRTITMADAATSGASFAFTVPDDWDSGALAVEIYFVGLTTAGGSVRFSVVSREVAEGADITTAGTTVTQTSQAPTTANLLVIEPSIALITPTGAGKLVKLNVRRLGADGADNYAASIAFVGVLISYTANQ